MALVKYGCCCSYSAMQCTCLSAKLAYTVQENDVSWCPELHGFTCRCWNSSEHVDPQLLIQGMKRTWILWLKYGAYQRKGTKIRLVALSVVCGLKEIKCSRSRRQLKASPWNLLKSEKLWSKLSVYYYMSLVYHPPQQRIVLLPPQIIDHFTFF